MLARTHNQAKGISAKELLYTTVNELITIYYTLECCLESLYQNMLCTINVHICNFCLSIKNKTKFKKDIEKERKWTCSQKVYILGG